MSKYKFTEKELHELRQAQQNGALSGFNVSWETMLEIGEEVFTCERYKALDTAVKRGIREGRSSVDILNEMFGQLPEEE